MSDLHSKYPHRWLTPAAVARVSPISGLGVIAIDEIKKGHVVGVIGGSIVHFSQIQDYRNIMTQVGIQIDDEYFIVPTSRAELESQGVYNHSCDPNIGFSNSITLIALRDIHTSEELVFDYAFCETFHDGFKCACGSDFCRKQITQEDWKIPEIQQKYGNYFSPYVKKKFL